MPGLGTRDERVAIFGAAHRGRCAPFHEVTPAGAPCFTDVIPDGPQGRAGIQTGAPQDDWIPGSRCARPGMTAEKRNVLAAAALLFVAVPPPVRSVS